MLDIRLFIGIIILWGMVCVGLIRLFQLIKRVDARLAKERKENLTNANIQNKRTENSRRNSC